MKKSKTLLLLLFVAGCSIMIWSCSKEAVVEPGYYYGTAEDIGLDDNMFEDAGDWSDMCMGDDGFKQSVADTVFKDQCVTALLDTTVHPKKLIIDFGPANCLCSDNRYRRGKIIVSFTGGYFDEETVITHTFDNYYVNDNKVMGSRTTVNKGRNTSGKMYWDVYVNGTVEKANNGGTTTWNSTRTRTWIIGEGEPQSNWEFEISGSATGCCSDGYIYSCIITQNLLKKSSCKWMVSGKLEILPKGYSQIELDYGNGTADNIVTVTINGSTQSLELK